MYDQALITLSILSATISLGLGFGFWYTVRRLGTLPPSFVTADELIAVDVIVPARNEALDLEAAVLSILDQQSIQLRVIVVNDHSTDRTPQIADSLAARDARITVIHDPPLVDGWFGKTNAM